jgi:hypothetical protein
MKLWEKAIFSFEKSYQVNPKDSFTVRDTLGLKELKC